MKLPALIGTRLGVRNPWRIIDHARRHPHLSGRGGSHLHVEGVAQPKHICLHELGRNPQRQQGLRLLLDLSLGVLSEDLVRPGDVAARIWAP